MNKIIKFFKKCLVEPKKDLNVKKEADKVFSKYQVALKDLALYDRGEKTFSK